MVVWSLYLCFLIYICVWWRDNGYWFIDFWLLEEEVFGSDDWDVSLLMGWVECE